MKFAKILILMVIVFTLSGCSSLKFLSSSSANTENPPTQSEAFSAQETPLSPAQLKTLSAEWIGADQDVISPTEMTPDQKPDGHIHITLPFTQPAAIKSIWIRYSEFGKSLKWGWIYNNNLPTNGYFLAVLDNSGKAVLQQSDNGYRVEGLTDLDLYFSELENQNNRDTLKFQADQTFSIEVDYVTQDNVVGQYNSSVKIEAAK